MPFATDGPDPKIRPFDELDPIEMEELLRWATEEAKLRTISDGAMNAINNGAVKAAGHYEDKDGNSVTPSVER
ncbi:hypothetical protein [Spirillospora sp. NPDC048819]|uniref:hypothetical protein n=1 Tax=Spirillospora sp. NPDC048819 TaxID=3155268 RepID=UPI0033FC5676